jgi:hypothetical protein
VRRAASWAATLVVALAALVGLVALINSRDQSGIDRQPDAVAGPGRPYRGEPVLSPALDDAVKRGNVIVLYRDAQPPAGTRALLTPGGKALEQAGQAVVLEREPTLTAPLAGVSAKKIEDANSPAQLQPFIDYWLGGR